MIIGSGFAKGLKLKTPKGESTRPTSARVRAAVLNMLTPYLDGAAFLDVFAGSGAMGLEAVSRGAKSCTFVEMAKDAILCLKDNVAEVERRAKAQNLSRPQLAVVGRDVAKALPELARQAPFDVMFADPPYALAADWARAMLGPLAKYAAAEAILIVESDVKDESLFAAPPGGWQVVKQRAYGDTIISMLSRPSSEGDGDGEVDGKGT